MPHPVRDAATLHPPLPDPAQQRPDRGPGATPSATTSRPSSGNTGRSIPASRCRTSGIAVQPGAVDQIRRRVIRQQAPQIGIRPGNRRASPPAGPAGRGPHSTVSAASPAPSDRRSASPPAATPDRPATHPDAKPPQLPAAPPPRCQPVHQRHGLRRIAARPGCGAVHPYPLDRQPCKPRNAGAQRRASSPHRAARGHTAHRTGSTAESADSPRQCASPGRRRIAPARLPDRRCRQNSRTPLPSRVIDIALMVKSRRAASCCQSAVKATTACRPSVSTSRRSVVISIPIPSTTAVTVPCARPVGTTLIPAACSAFITTSGGNGVARSMSATGRSPAHPAPRRPRPALLASVPQPVQRRIVHGGEPGCVTDAAVLQHVRDVSPVGIDGVEAPDPQQRHHHHHGECCQTVEQKGGAAERETVIARRER